MAKHLQAIDRRKIEKLYLSDVKPAEIARKLGLRPASLRQHVYRAGLTQRRDEIAVAKRRTVLEVLEGVRRRSTEDFEAVLGLLGEGVKIDAKRLRDGWDLVETAPDASSLQRAKALHLDRVFRLHGVEKPAAGSQSGSFNVTQFVLRCDTPGREVKQALVTTVSMDATGAGVAPDASKEPQNTP